MKRTILFLFMASGMVFAADNTQQQPNDAKKLSSYDRIALESASPHVHLAKKHTKNGDQSGRVDRIEVNKTTIVALMPVGK